MTPTRRAGEDAVEWAVFYAREFPLGPPHRGPMPEIDARAFVREFIEDGGKLGVFYVCRRPVGDWEVVHA